MSTVNRQSTTGATTRGPRTAHPVAAGLAAVVLATGLVGSGGTAQAATGHQDWGAASQFIGQINSARASHGRPRLAVSSALSSVAASWAASMARSNSLAHNPRLAGSVSGWRVLGENVGVGPSVSSLESAFYGSAEHRANMLDPTFTMVGVAVVDVGDKLWVVEDFEQPLHGRSTSSPGSSGHSAGSHRVGTHARAARTAPALTAVQAARLHQLERLFAARHKLVLPGLTVHTARQRSQLHR